MSTFHIEVLRHSRPFSRAPFPGHSEVGNTVNRFRLVPRLSRIETMRHLRRNSLAEMLLGAMVILIVAVLGTISPPVHMPMHGPHMHVD
jgi:hypothetical protein